MTRGFSGAAKAVVIAEYWVLPTGWGFVRWLAGLVILGFAALHFGGLRVSTVFQNVTTLLKVLTLLLYVLLLAIIVGTQPGLVMGGGLMIGSLAVAGWWTARRPGALRPTLAGPVSRR